MNTTGVGVCVCACVGPVECVKSLRYLGCTVTPDARCSTDVSIASASEAFHRLKSPVFLSSHFTIATKRYV